LLSDNQFFQIRSFVAGLDAIHIYATRQCADIQFYTTFVRRQVCVANRLAGHRIENKGGVALFDAVIDRDLVAGRVGIGGKRRAVIACFDACVAVLVVHFHVHCALRVAVVGVVDGDLEQSHLGVGGHVEVNVSVAVGGVACQLEGCRHVAVLAEYTSADRHDFGRCGVQFGAFDDANQVEQRVVVDCRSELELIVGSGLQDHRVAIGNGLVVVRKTQSLSLRKTDATN